MLISKLSTAQHARLTVKLSFGATFQAKSLCADLHMCSAVSPHYIQALARSMVVEFPRFLTAWPQRVAPLLKRCTRDGVTRDHLVKPVGRIFQTETRDTWNPKSESSLSRTDFGSDAKEA